MIISLQCRRPLFHPWVRKFPWRSEWQPTPVFLPGEFHGQRSLVGYCPWGCKESDLTEQLTLPLLLLKLTSALHWGLPFTLEEVHFKSLCVCKVALFLSCSKDSHWIDLSNNAYFWQVLFMFSHHLNALTFPGVIFHILFCKKPAQNFVLIWWSQKFRGVCLGKSSMPLPNQVMCRD